MVPTLTRRLAIRAGCITALAVLTWYAPRAGMLAALLISIWWVGRRDDDAGTWGVLYVILLLIIAVLTLLVAGLALTHRLLSG